MRRNAALAKAEKRMSAKSATLSLSACCALRLAQNGRCSRRIAASRLTQLQRFLRCVRTQQNIRIHKLGSNPPFAVNCFDFRSRPPPNSNPIRYIHSLRSCTDTSACPRSSADTFRVRTHCFCAVSVNLTKPEAERSHNRHKMNAKLIYAICYKRNVKAEKSWSCRTCGRRFSVHSISRG